MAEKDFVGFLVDETLKLQLEREGKLSCLEQKLTDYDLAYLKGEFIPQFQVLRFRTSWGNMDVPINWSLFSPEMTAGALILTKEDDTDTFFSVMKATWQGSMEQLLITHDDGYCYIVGLKKGEDHCLHDLLNPQEWLNCA